jgi:hypothetical protein
VDKIDENDLLEDFKINSIDLILTIFIEQNISITLQNLIKFCFESIGMHAGFWHSFSHYTDQEGHECLLFRHNYWIKWSKVLSKGILHLLNVQFGFHAETTLFSSRVMIKILEKKRWIKKSIFLGILRYVMIQKYLCERYSFKDRK